MKRAYSNLSISSIVSDSTLNNEDPELGTKTNSCLRLLLDAFSDTNSENVSLGNENIELLNVLKFDVKSQPIDIRKGLQTVAAILKSEGLPVVDETALQICLEKRKIQNKMKERQEKLLKAKYNEAFARYNALEKKSNCIRKEVERIEEELRSTNDGRIEVSRVLWTEKLRDYRGKAQELEEELNVSPIQDISLESILNESSLLINKFDDSAHLNENLERYGNLPPNLLQAKKELDYKKQELEEIENLIQEKLES